MKLLGEHLDARIHEIMFALFERSKQFKTTREEMIVTASEILIALVNENEKEELLSYLKDEIDRELEARREGEEDGK